MIKIDSLCLTSGSKSPSLCKGIAAQESHAQSCHPIPLLGSARVQHMDQDPAEAWLLTCLLCAGARQPEGGGGADSPQRLGPWTGKLEERGRASHTGSAHQRGDLV